MSELEPTRESDARIAEAMGWSVRVHKVPDYPLVYLACPPWPPHQEQAMHKYTTDWAMVLPMWERVAELGKGWVNMAYDPLKHIWHAHAYNDGMPVQAEGPTANLAVAAALLAVWEAAAGRGKE